MIFAEALANKIAIVSKPVGVAETSDFWHIGDTKEELLNGCKKMLLKSTKEGIKTYKITDTVNSYLKMYHV
jgi:hypothetical protein